jgi:hypothetical protein
MKMKMIKIWMMKMINKLINFVHMNLMIVMIQYKVMIKMMMNY